jgi:hypothetical protein
MALSLPEIPSPSRPVGDQLLTLYDVLRPDAVLGRHAGRCRLCARSTSAGHAESPSSKFSAWPLLAHGDCFCEFCWALLKRDELRRTSWAAWNGELRRESAADRTVWNALVHPPAAPFCVYQTLGRKKQGWLTLMHKVGSARLAWVGTDWTDAPVPITPHTVARYAPLIEFLRGYRLPRSALADGRFTPKQVEVAIHGGWLPALRTAMACAHDPAWKVLAHACP